MNELLPNIFSFLIKIDPFDKLPDSLVENISRNIKISYLAKGQKIHFSHLCKERFLYIIRTGAVEQLKPDGSLRSRLGEDDQFGFTFLEPLSKSEDGYQVIALENTLLYLIPHAVLQHLLSEHPQYTPYFAAQAETRLSLAVKHASTPHDEQHFFYRRVSEIASKNIAVVDAQMSIRDVAKNMREVARSSCAVIVDNAEIIGLMTDRDMTTRVVANNVDLSAPITQVMTPSPTLISADDKVMQAISLMLQHNIRCLPVVQGKEVIGLLTTSHLVHNHRTQALFLIEKIKYANSPEALAALKDERQTIFEALVESGIHSDTVGLVMAMIMDAFNRRLIQLAEDKLGTPPCNYAWVVAGSHARNEVHLLSDQDSAIVIDDSATAADMTYFTHLAMIVCNGLAACGYPLCDGKFMAASPKWCKPLSLWKQYYTKWVSSPEYNKLLNITVFLEVRTIYGDPQLVTELQQHLHQCLTKSHNFLPSLIKDAVETQPPLGIFNNLVLEKSGQNSHTLNIKKYALTLIIDLARIYSLAAGGMLTGTEERFRYAYEHGVLSESSYKNIIGAYQFITQVRFTHQLMALQQGKAPDNHIQPNSFSSFERKHLKDAFKIISELQDVTKLKLLKG